MNVRVAVNASNPSKTAHATNVGPVPRRFAVDSSRPGHFNDVAKCGLATVLRLGAGALVDGYSFSLEKRDKQARDRTYGVLKVGPYVSVERGGAWSTTTTTGSRQQPDLVLYARMDGPGKKVREALSILDLDCLVYPSTRSWEGFDANEGSLLFVDRSGDREMKDPDDICAYLFGTYGGGEDRVPWVLRRGNGMGDILLKVALWLRGDRGNVYRGRESKGCVAPCEFWAYEASPFCGVVAEVLSEAGVPHVLKSVARGSSKRDELFEQMGHFQAPFFVDPNEDSCLFESASIIEYVESRYAKD
jgi:hypothetical protein